MVVNESAEAVYRGGPASRSFRSWSSTRQTGRSSSRHLSLSDCPSAACARTMQAYAPSLSRTLWKVFAYDTLTKSLRRRRRPHCARFPGLQVRGDAHERVTVPLPRLPDAAHDGGGDHRSRASP